jgi:hypothetical protein
MASIHPLARSVSLVPYARPVVCARSMGRHTAGALLLFTLLQIAGVVALAPLPGGRLLPIFAIVMLMLVAIPFGRMIDQRWSRLRDAALPSSGLLHAYRRDRARLWRLACIVPTLWLGLFAAVAQATTL